MLTNAQAALLAAALHADRGQRDTTPIVTKDASQYLEWLEEQKG